MLSFCDICPSLVIVLVYVDNILVTWPNPTVCNNFISKLGGLFPVKDLGPSHYFLELEVHRSLEGIFLSQGKYILDLLIKTKMEGCKPSPTHLSSNKLDHISSLLSNPHGYRSIVRARQYLTWTMHDISFQLIKCVNFFIVPEILIFKQLKCFSDFWKDPLLRVYGLRKVLCTLLHSLMLTGLVVFLISDILVDFVLIWAATSLAGVPRNKQ